MNETRKQDGTWGGNLELQALSLHLGRNITVHQAGQRPWVLQNHASAPMLHVAYHGAEHYNSVRGADDAAAVITEAAAISWDAAAVKQVIQGTGVWDEGRVAAALGACKGNVDQVGGVDNTNMHRKQQYQ